MITWKIIVGGTICCGIGSFPTCVCPVCTPLSYPQTPRESNSQVTSTIPINSLMALENDTVAGATIELLETRLRRLTYLLTGDANWTGEPTPPAKPASLDDSISRRLLRLEKDLERLSRNIPAVRDVLSLRMSMNLLS